MNRKQFWKVTSGTAALLGMLGKTVAVAAEPALTLATSLNSIGQQFARSPRTGSKLTTAAKVALLQQNIRYVFVLFQENRSFDTYFGTYPGANGLVSTYAGADPTDDTAQPADQMASYVQNIRNTDGSYSTMSPFLAPRTINDVHGATLRLYPESFYSVDHSHAGYMADFHLNYSGSRTFTKNDGYALDQEGLQYVADGNAANSSVTTGGNVVVKSSTGLPTGAAPTSNPSLTSKQKGEAALAHQDCDTIPLLWHFADVGTLFDNIHQTITGPSTPNAIALISAQSGATQWAEHPTTTGSHTATYTIPNETDSAPFAGSAVDDFAGKPPYGPGEKGFANCATAGTQSGTYNNTACPAPARNDPAYGAYTNNAVVALRGALAAVARPQLTLTFASLPLSFMGAQVNNITAQDAHPVQDLSDVQHDIRSISTSNPAVSWSWYQQGFDAEPFDATSASPKTVDLHPANTPHSSYIVHHNGPQYFGYLGDNPAEVANMHSLQRFYTDVANQALPSSGGVFYVRGGYYNNDGLQSADPSPAVRATFAGNDDHGSYSDSQISEALVADSVNAIASSPYWPQSAIIITWDESDGFYDHVPESIRSFGPDGLPLSGGPRIPTIVLSPYGAAHAVSHVYAEHGSVVRFINTVFGLRPLSDLPDEVAAQKAGAANALLNTPSGQPQTALAPNDGTAVSDMLEAFDNDRLLGVAPAIPASAVMVPASTVHTLPQYDGAGCSALAITPTDYPNGYSVGGESDPPPQDFNPRPTVSPGIPYMEQTIIGGVTTSPWTP